MSPDPGSGPASPRPAASVLLVRAGGDSGVQVYMIRRQKDMRFLGGWYAFPGGKVDQADAAPDLLGRCRGVAAGEAARVLGSSDGVPALAFWVTAARELLEETGVLLARDDHGRAVDAADTGVATRVERIRRLLIADQAPLAPLLADEGWWLDLAPVRYLSHFITPPSSPIRFTARFFLAPVPAGQEPRFFAEEASEGFWVDPPTGHRRYEGGEMPMAEPAEAALRYLAEFPSLDALWAAHADGRHKFHGINDRLDAAGFRVQRKGSPRRSS